MALYQAFLDFIAINFFQNIDYSIIARGFLPLELKYLLKELEMGCHEKVNIRISFGITHQS
jgi:hypothetical protein